MRRSRWIALHHLQPCGNEPGRLAVIAAVEAAVKASVVMVETASAAMEGGGQSPAVLGLGLWPVAEGEENPAAEEAGGGRGGGGDGQGGPHQRRREACHQG